MQKKLKFEEKLNKLDTIVIDLEQGNLTLDESLILFQDGIELVKDCQKELETAERKVEVLIKDSKGDIAVENFE